MKALFLPLFLLVSTVLWGQVTINVTLPVNTPQGEDIYIAGSFNSWNPADLAYKLTQKPGNVYTIDIAAQTGTIKFKFTRGSWATVEATANGSFRPDREFTFGNGQTIDLTIDGWEDQKAGGNSTALSNVKVISNTFAMPQLGRTRRVLIYLPNNYAVDSPTRYPVIYMHDGQNVFDAATSFAGEWGVDETLSQLEINGDKGVIVVAIDNSSNRIAEYTPYKNSQYGGGEGDKYVDFIVQTLKPYIDANFRTLSNRQNTAIAGSSLGGVISLYAAVKYQGVFSKVGVFSPAYWINKDSLQNFITSTGYKQPLRVYTVGGKNESQSLVGDISDIENTLTQAGFDAAQRKVSIHNDGAHSEWYWKREFGSVYQWLFANTNTTSLKEIHSPTFDYKLYPNPADTQLIITLGDAQMATYKIYDVKAKLVAEGKIVGLETIDIRHLLPATYRIEVVLGKEIVNKSFVKR